MIKKITYKFELTYESSLEYDVPVIHISFVWWALPDECILDLELSLLSWTYVREIVKELEEVKRWVRDAYEFWFETTNIWVYQKWKWYYWNKYPKSEVTITYNYADDYIVTKLTIKQVLQMMTDWRNYIDEWEKETGKIKKRWDES